MLWPSCVMWTESLRQTTNSAGKSCAVLRLPFNVMKLESHNSGLQGYQSRNKPHSQVKAQMTSLMITVKLGVWTEGWACTKNQKIQDSV